MYLMEQYTLYRLASQLVTNDDYEILYFNDAQDEVWLEKTENKKTKVVRLFHKGFNWKNHLKKDIATVFQKTKMMKKRLMSKNIEIYNIYIASLPPIDDWEMLKKPLQLKEKNPLKMKVYYMEENNYTEEQKRFIGDSNASVEAMSTTPSEQLQEKEVHDYKVQFKDHFYNKRKEVEKIFTYGKPLLTYYLIAINILLFLALELTGGSMNIENLIQFGAKYNPAIVNGEWWRIITSMFLHIGLLHLVMNMIAVYYLGMIVERIYGSIRFVFIYFLAGIGGGLASFTLSESVSAGASGALFGLFGALLFFGLIYKKIFFQTMGKSLLLILAFNIVFSFVVPQIDIGAHMGGLTAGFLASAICQLPSKKQTGLQIIALVLYLLFITTMVVFGLESN
ncbi:rhomboid family intramembrane serine protease [Virgibacillus sp. W0181]|uniref:rhomboid family intramembrane serine protease n=1 Tax=Virgibacillus sp. W0181 TaxID=3391581 RepID=UPI003F4655CF